METLKREPPDSQSAAIGHYQPLWMHNMTSASGAVTMQRTAAGANLMRSTPGQANAASGALVQAECWAHAALEAQWQRDGYLLLGWNRQYSAGAILLHRSRSYFDANDPFGNVNADISVIGSFI